MSDGLKTASIATVCNDDPHTAETQADATGAIILAETGAQGALTLSEIWAISTVTL